jgi:hypothetical protein
MVKPEKVIKYINLIKSCEYVKPDKPMEDFTPDEVVCQAVYDYSLSTSLCAATVVILCEYPIIYPFFKSYAKYYHSKFGKSEK